MARALRGRFEPSDHFVLGHPSTLELLSALGSPVERTRFKTLIYLKGFGVGACGALVSTSKVLAQMNPGRGAKRPRSIRLYAMQQGGKGRILLRSALPTCPGLQWLGPFPPPSTAGHHWVRLIDVIDVVG